MIVSQEEEQVKQDFQTYIEEEEIRSPLLLTRGAHTTTPLLKEQRTSIDWISFTAEEEVQVLQEFVQVLLPFSQFHRLKHGMPGYKHVKEIVLSGQTIGRIGYGADHKRNLLTLTGQGSQKIDLAKFVQYYEILQEARFSRIDIAYDIFDNSITHELVAEAYQENKFTLLKSARKPSINTIGTVDGYGRNKGRTITIGNKKSGKLIRCYEKGLERFAKIYETVLKEEQQAIFYNNLLCSDIEEQLPTTSILNWYRLEVQYGNNDRDLNLDMIINRDQFFSGAYPFCQEVLNLTETKKPQRIPNNLETEEEIMFKHLGDQYGSFLFTMLSKGYSPNQILKKAIKHNSHLNQRFIKAGGLDQIKPFDPTILED